MTLRQDQKSFDVQFEIACTVEELVVAVPRRLGIRKGRQDNAEMRPNFDESELAASLLHLAEGGVKMY